MTRSRTLPLSLLLFPLLVAACGGGDASGGGGAGSGPAAAVLPERFLLTAAPAEALDVAALREGVAPGALVAVRGKVRELGAGFATLTLTDLGLASCDERNGDACPTPWDYCCEDPTTLAARSVQVEFRDGADPLVATVEGFHGLARLSTVVVRGRFEPDEAGNLLLVADGIHVGT